MMSFSSSVERNNSALAKARAESVSAVLRAAGIVTEVGTEYPVPNQRKMEQEQGYALFNVARVDLLQSPQQ